MSLMILLEIWLILNAALLSIAAIRAYVKW